MLRYLSGAMEVVAMDFVLGRNRILRAKAVGEATLSSSTLINLL
jgi:hypothetical protein